MNLRQRKVIWSIVPLLVLSLSQFYVQASLTTPDTPAPPVPQSAPLLGRLDVHKGDHTQVDGHDVKSGETILDGQTIQTSSCTSATVHLLTVGATGVEVGQIDLAANTKAVIHYSAAKASATLERGCARVRVQHSLVGSIDTPDGKTTPATLPDTLDRIRAEVCYPRDNNQDYSPDCIPPIVWIVGAGAAAGTVAAVVAPRGENPSGSTPIAR